MSSLRELGRRRPQPWLRRLVVILLRLLALAVAWQCVERTVLRRGERRPKRPPSRGDCQPIPSEMYRRPDPLIYDQYYLAAQGLAVTWDNPDIHVEQNGVVVDQHDLKPGERYDIVARVWNGSIDAPVAQLPVVFSYLSFGISTQRHPIGQALVDLGVKGSTQCPAFARTAWTTPAQSGHYCLQVELIWFDDANPYNNLGQSNTDVKALNSPRAAFSIPVANPARDTVALTLRVDSYVIPPLGICPPITAGHEDDVEATRRARVAEQRAARQAPAAGWSVTLDPPQLEMAPGQISDVSVELEAPDGFVGTETFNVNAFDPHGRLVGGVTLYARS